MTKYLYVSLALCLCLAAAGVVLMRPDLRRNALVLAAFGVVWGPFSEYWFFKDYWRPQSFLGGHPWLEDVLFGLGISVMGGTVYKFITRRGLGPTGAFRRHRWLVAGFPLAYIAAMVVLQAGFGVNSIIVSMIMYLAFATIIVISRRDLLVPAMASGVLMALLATIGYAVGLDWIIDGRAALDALWLLSGKPLGATILGNVPLTEVFWYACWGCLLGVAYECVTGSTLVSPARASSRLGQDQKEHDEVE